LPRPPLAAEPAPEAATEAVEEAVGPVPADREVAALDTELAMVPEDPDDVGAMVRYVGTPAPIFGAGL
jgi:hypothetical protein